MAFYVIGDDKGLKDVSEIVPAEMARIINRHTISHASNHSELWDDITEDGIKVLNDMIKDATTALGGEVEVTDVTYGITLKDGKYESMTMTCQYTVTVAGETSNINFTVGVDFTYGDFAKVEVPSDASSYQEVSYSDLIGG